MTPTEPRQAATAQCRRDAAHVATPVERACGPGAHWVTWPVATELDVRPLSPLIGAEIHGVDLSRPLAERVVADVRQALNTHHVVFFRDQELTPAQQADFARQFGEVTEGHPVIPALEGNPEVLAIDGREDRASWWHTDVTFLQAPAFGSILYMPDCPEVGGDTMWASLQDAYDRLSEPVRTMCDTLIAIHFDPWFAADVDARGRLRVARRALREAPPRPPPGGPHPSRERSQRPVREPPVHPDHPRAVEARERRPSSTCSTATVSQPELTCRFRWRPGSVAFWDNRATLHYALDDYGDATPYRPPGHPAGRRALRPGHAPTLTRHRAGRLLPIRGGGTGVVERLGSSGTPCGGTVGRGHRAGDGQGLLAGPQVGGQGPRVPGHLVGRARRHHRAGLHHHHLGAQLEHQGHVVLDQHDGGVGHLVQPAQQGDERLRLALGDAGGGLVEQQQPGSGQHDRGQVDHPPGAGGQLGDAVVAEPLDPEASRSPGPPRSAWPARTGGPRASAGWRTPHRPVGGRRG